MKNILLIGGSSGIGYELSMKLENDHNVLYQLEIQISFLDQILVLKN